MILKTLNFFLEKDELKKKMNGTWLNVPSLKIDAWFLKILIWFFLNKWWWWSFFFLWKMNVAWPNAPSLTINVNFKKFYCTNPLLKQNRSKNRPKKKKHKIDQNRGCWKVCQLALLKCRLAHSTLVQFSHLQHIFRPFQKVFSTIFHCKTFS